MFYINIVNHLNMAITKTLLFIFLLAISGCKKDKVTQTGANTMSAKVNGKAWEQKPCSGCLGGGDGLQVDYSDRDFFFIEGEQHDQGILITVVIVGLKNTGTFKLGDKQTDIYADVYLTNSANTNLNYYKTSATKGGTAVITKLDLKKKIISGTFEFTATDQNNVSNTIQVTDGKFDVTFF